MTSQEIDRLDAAGLLNALQSLAREEGPVSVNFSKEGTCAIWRDGVGDGFTAATFEEAARDTLRASPDDYDASGEPRLRDELDR